ncbi:MAG: hypothetical protein IH840_06965, partial [Candidatus Heimdallarchaeota archaeon]|nr:hypothetical protein [Candidatus Heimdallarchaeota archaeon]
MSDLITLDSTLPNMTGKTIALFGDLSAKRNHIIKQFILEGLQSEGTTCIVSLTSSASDLIYELGQFSPDAAMLVDDAILNERLQIVDMYSFRGVQTEEDIPGVHMLQSANDLTILSITLNQISKRFEKTRFVIWPFSLLSIYTLEKDIINFTQTLSARLNSRKQAGLLVADTGVVNQHLRATLESIVDSVVETRRTEENTGIQEWY